MEAVHPPGTALRILHIRSFKPGPTHLHAHTPTRTECTHRECAPCPWQQPGGGRADGTNLHPNRFAAPPPTKAPWKADPRHLRFISMVKVTRLGFKMKAGVEIRDRKPGQGRGLLSPGRGRRPNRSKGARALGRLDSIVVSEPRSDPEMIPRFVTLDTGLKGGPYQDRNIQEAEQQQQKRQNRFGRYVKGPQ